MLKSKPKGIFFLTRSFRYQPMAIIAANLKRLNANFPNSPPKDKPKAMPSFSVK
jgi:hypothetical protein